MGAEASKTAITGRVAAIRGTVLEVDMDGQVPAIATALECRLSKEAWVSAVIQAHVGAARVRAVALASTRGLERGAEVRSEGRPLTVPVGEELLGRVVDLSGHPLDGGPPNGGPPIEAAAYRALRRPAGHRPNRPGRRPGASHSDASPAESEVSAGGITR